MQAPRQPEHDADTVRRRTDDTAEQERRWLDDRPTAAATQRDAVVDMMNDSPRMSQQRALGDAISGGARMVAQRAGMHAMFGGAAPAGLAPVRSEEKPNRTGLPDHLKSGMESLSGMSLDHLKVHYNSDKPAQLQAHAYAQGAEIHLGAGQEKHLPHEAWHVVQQAQGRVRPTGQLKGGAMVNDDPHLEAEADMMGVRAMSAMANHAPLRQSARHGARSAPAVQRVAMDVQVSGLTHLVASKGGSLYNGEEGEEVADGERLEIDTDDRILSRRGPNQEVHGEADRLGEQIYTWVRVLAVKGRRMPSTVYIREDAIGNILPMPQGLEVNERRQRQGSPDGGEQAKRPASIWFTKADVLGACDALEKMYPNPSRKAVVLRNVNNFLKALPADTLEQTPDRIRGLEKFEVTLQQEAADRSKSVQHMIVAYGILTVAKVPISEAIAAQMEKDSLHRDWYHDFAGMLAMLAERKDLSELAIGKLLKFHLMQHQVQAPYGDEAMKRSGRKASPLLSEDYARGMRTRLWSVATAAGLSDLLTHMFGSTAQLPNETAKAHQKRILPINKTINDFNKAFYTVSTPAPFQVGDNDTLVLDTPPKLPAADRCTYIRSLKLQIVPTGVMSKKNVDSHMGGRGQRSSPSESAGIAAVAMAKLVRAGKINDALELIEPQFRDGTAKGEKKPLSKFQYDSRMLIAPREHDPQTGRWRDPLLSSTKAQLEELELAYGALRSAVSASKGTALFSANLKVFDNLVGGRIDTFFDAQTPAQVTASVTDTLETAARWASRHAGIVPDSEAPAAMRAALSEQKLCLDHYYQAMQSLHEAVRFKLSWDGTDPRILEQGIRHMLPGTAPEPTSVHASPHGLGMIGQIHHALGKTDKVGVLKSAYYETPGIFDNPYIAANVTDKALLDKDLIVLEPHPNNAEERDVTPHDPLILLAALAESSRHHTVMMDVTLNHLDEPEIAEILNVAAPLIERGSLNLIFMQSGTKFLQHGMDISSLGIGVVFNKGKNWLEFNRQMAATPQATPDDDTVYLGRMLKTNKKELGEYLDRIRVSTALLKERLREKLKPGSALEVTLSTDDKTVYVAIAPTGKFVSDHYGHGKEAAMHYAYKVILKEMADLSLVGRPSFGFNLTNLGECLTTIRITPGIEEAEMLNAYAEGIAAADSELLLHPVGH